MFIKQILKRALQRAYSIAVQNNAPMMEDMEHLGHYHHVDQGTQILLRLKYQEMLRNNVPLPPLDSVEFRSYSQNGEDGILLFIFSLIGTTNKKAVEISVGNGMECNAANLIINHGWRGLLFDGSEENIAVGRNFYKNHKDTWISPPTLVSAWITRDNVNQLILSHDFSGEIDLLSIDIDGNDYWIWEAIECIQPRVVVLEHNTLWEDGRAITIPYQENFVADLTAPVYYLGASLPAFVKLGHKKGYRLVGVQRLGFNAFFVRTGVGEEILSEVTVEECLESLNIAPLSEAQRAAIELLSQREYIEV
jgi:hypothetical protein